MAKTALELKSFHNGINSKTNSRDILDDELVVGKNISVDSIGKIVMSGGKSEITTTNLTLATMKDSYGLFRFSADWDKVGTENTETDYLIVFDDSEGKLYWLPSSETAWETRAQWLDLSSDWGTAESSSPMFYYVDGALRMSDGNFSNTNNAPQWIGNINRTLFPDSGNSGILVYNSWYRENQELEKPTSGSISSLVANAPTAGIAWQVRNLVPDALIYDFHDTNTGYGVEDGSNTNTLYTHSEQISGTDGAASNGITDEHWLTSRSHADGYNDSKYHSFGIMMSGENDDHSNTYTWETQTSWGSSHIFKTGKSIYMAVRLPGDENKEFWQGIHTRAFTESSSLALNVLDGFVTFKQSNGSYAKFKIDHTKFTDISTVSGQWHIVEFPYDEAYENSVSGDFYPNTFLLSLELSWVVTGSVSLNGTSDGASSPYTRWRDTPGWDLIQISDIRIGDPDLIGVTTLGKQKFLTSYTYDDTENESLLYDFGDTDANDIGKVVLSNSTSSYQIGITAKVHNAPANKRITGANLYMEDDGVPYRIAELRYLKGLKGAWESEYPSTSRFALDSNNRVTSTIKTDGLSLLESYEAINGFSPNVNTNIASYKTATILNRRTYIANIYQDSKKYSDRMIKSNANSFDVFPSEGKGIDVVKNDGDSIIKLESYADRILQFKKNVMHLINATRDSEFLEDSFFGKGIASQSASSQTDVGIAWANENGAYLYNGESILNLTDGKIDEDDWKAHINDSTDTMYNPLKKKIIITGGVNGNNIYEYCFFTKSWTTSTNKLSDLKTNFILDIDNKIKYIENDSKLYEFINTPKSSNEFKVITKDFTFGNPATRKKCFKFYITYKSSGIDVPTNVKVFYGVNGEDLQGISNGTEISTSSNFSGTTDNCYTTSGLKSTNNKWKQAELIPPSTINNVYSVQLHFKSEGETSSAFEINDITIVYREKPLK
tara:strand:+ start:1458 stop:4304 length:2847 start_codon:yes stop_codon:yes gene_type:complete